MSEKNVSLTNKKIDVRKLIMMALFTALAYVSLYVCHFRVEFLSFEPKDAVITIAAFMYGPVAGVCIAVVTSVIEMFTMSTTGVYGLVMNILASATFAGVAGLVYKYKKTIAGAVVGLVSAIAAMTAVMIAANMIITPYYMGAPRQAVIQLIVPLLLPFNVVKGVFNAALAMLLYKPFVTALRAVGMMSKEKADGKLGKTSIIVTVVSVATVAAAMLYFLLVLGGVFKLS